MEIDLPNYIISDLIHENNRIKVYKGYTSNGRMPVVIKVLKKEAVNTAGISRLMYEYEIARNLNIEGIVKPVRLEQAGHIFAIVMEDVGAVSLRKYIQAHPVGLADFLDIAAGLSEVLGRIHRKGIIHRDLKPENILLHPGTRRVYIIDFSSAVLFSKEDKNTPVPNNPAGTPGYMSPEQTGWLNIGIDQRSDLYSLGIIFYEMLTGMHPFQAENPAEWIYVNMTQKPQLPEKINPGIPRIVSDMIMKLLTKAVEKRYQSAYGLLRDLKECRRRLFQTGRIDSFPIGRFDVSASLQLPRKLYGREKEKKALISAFERVCEGRAGTIFVGGYPGIGKTMLINEGLKPVVLEKGYFIAGKFDQLERNIPYAPFAAAFGDLVKRLMTESREKLDWWKKRIFHAVGRSGAVITEIIPELEWVIGKQPPVDVLPPKEAENRFLMVFRDFVRAFAWKDHPLVLFLDDLQWADHASINLLKYLTRDANLPFFLFIGAFRENEVSGDHPLTEVLEATRKDHRISLIPLELDEVADLVAETLHTENTAALSEVLYRKSGGNPFFLGQLIMLIHNEGLLYFDPQEGCWRWKLESVQQLQPGEDVLELILDKLQRLPEETGEVLKLAACIGNRFDLETLAAVCNKSLEETTSCLMPAVLEGLVLAVENEKAGLPPAYFEFLHDRVQQAVYSSIPEDEKKGKHIAVGRLILRNTVRSGLEEKILSIMDHFNRSLELVHDPEERTELAEYNLLAGRKAKTSAAYASALQYFRSGRTLLPDDAWEYNYKLSYDLHLELAQAEYLSANVKAAEELFDTVIGKAGNELERASVYGLKVMLYASMGKYVEAVQTGIGALEKLGVKLPVHPKKLDYARELLLYRWYMRNKKIEDLIHLPEITDPVQRKVADLLARLSSVTINCHPDLFGFVILKTGNHAVRHGNTEMNSVGYFGYSIFAGSMLGDYESGDRFGRVSVQLVERYNRGFSKCITYFGVGALVTHWTRHASSGLEYLKKAVRSGIEAGETLVIGYAHLVILEVGYLLGTSLEKVAEEIRKKSKIAGELKHDSLAVNVAIYEKVVSALQGRNTGSLASSAEEFRKEKISQLKQNDQASLATFYLYKMQLCYMAGKYRDALSAAQNAQLYIEAITGFMTTAEYNFYYSLVITALYGEMSFKERKFHRKTLKKNQRQMKKWSEACKENFLHKYLLIEAETARLENRGEKAMFLYDQAVQSARQNGYIQYEALANELAAKFYLSRGLGKVARTYMLDACRGYNSWGAFAKVKELQNRYPELLAGMDFEDQKNGTAEGFENILGISAPSDGNSAESLDMYFIDKAVEEISKESDINKLFESFLDIATQSIGADRGYLILEKNGELFIEAIKDSNFGRTVVKTVKLENCRELSRAVVRYVARTLEKVVLNYGDQTGIFAGDPYIAESNPKSIACVPLLLRGIPFGVLYFENSFLTGAFTPGRLKALKLLTTQIAYAKNLQSYMEDTGEPRIYPYLVEPLTKRETEVLRLIEAGLSNSEIAERLEMTVNTVKTHIKNIYGKLQVNRRIQVVARAKELNIL